MSDRIKKIFESYEFADDEDDKTVRLEKFKKAVRYRQQQKELNENKINKNTHKLNSPEIIFLVCKLIWIIIIIVSLVLGAIIGGFWGCVGGLFLSFIIPIVLKFVLTH